MVSKSYIGSLMGTFNPLNKGVSHIKFVCSVLWFAGRPYWTTLLCCLATSVRWIDCWAVTKCLCLRISLSYHWLFHQREMQNWRYFVAKWSGYYLRTKTI